MGLRVMILKVVTSAIRQAVLFNILQQCSLCVRDLLQSFLLTEEVKPKAIHTLHPCASKAKTLQQSPVEHPNFASIAYFDSVLSEQSERRHLSSHLG